MADYKVSPKKITQKTIKKEVSIKGRGLFSGQEVTLTLSPSKENTGIVFERGDLPGNPRIVACLENVQNTPRCTQLSASGVSVLTVEHLLSALAAYEIDNLVIRLEGPEIPVGDGSAQMFIELLDEAEVVSQSATSSLHFLERPIYWSEGETHLVALPSEEYRVSYTLHYPHSLFLRSQFYSFSLNREGFKKEIAPSRTFSLFEEIQPMLTKGWLKGGGLDNGIVIEGDRVMNPEGVRFPDEMVRHKILDLLGDLSLIGHHFRCHIIAIRSGHFSNVLFARKLKQEIVYNLANVTTFVTK